MVHCTFVFSEPFTLMVNQEPWTILVCLVSFQMIVEEAKDEESSVMWKAVEQVYRFGLGAVAGGKLC